MVHALVNMTASLNLPIRVAALVLAALFWVPVVVVLGTSVALLVTRLCAQALLRLMPEVTP